MRFFQKSREKAKTLLSSATTTTERRNRKEKTHVECANSVASSSIYVTCVRVSIVLLFFLRARARSFFFSFSSPFSENFKTLNSIAEKKISAHTRFTHKTHSAAHSRLKHTHTHTNTRTRERERERERKGMIADAFFSFLNWLRLLFFNREMELALIGANCVGFLRGKVFVLYSLSLLLLLCLLLLLLLQKPKTRAVGGLSRGGARF